MKSRERSESVRFGTCFFYPLGDTCGIYNLIGDQFNLYIDIVYAEIHYKANYQ